MSDRQFPADAGIGRGAVGTVLDAADRAAARTERLSALVAELRDVVQTGLSPAGHAGGYYGALRHALALIDTYQGQDTTT